MPGRHLLRGIKQGIFQYRILPLRIAETHPPSNLVFDAIASMERRNDPTSAVYEANENVSLKPSSGYPRYFAWEMTCW